MTEREFAAQAEQEFASEAWAAVAWEAWEARDELTTRQVEIVREMVAP